MGQVHWSWEAEVKPGALENFKSALVRPWNVAAEEDEHTLENRWVVSESGESVKVYQKFSSAEAALAQFRTNDGWAKLDDYLNPTAIFVSGDYGDTLDFLRAHGAIFMLDL